MKAELAILGCALALACGSGEGPGGPPPAEVRVFAARRSGRRIMPAPTVALVMRSMTIKAPVFRFSPKTSKTIGDWSVKDDWEAARLNFHSSPVRIKQLLQAELLNLAQGKEAKLPADSISKLFSALDKVEKKVDATVVSRILKELDNFIAEANPKLALELTHYHKQFLIHRINLES